MRTDEAMREGEYWVWKDDMLEALCQGEHLEACSAQGSNDAAVAAALQDPTVLEVAERLPENCQHLLTELRETGAWDAEELADHWENLRRIVWMIACDWKEERNAG